MDVEEALDFLVSNTWKLLSSSCQLNEVMNFVLDFCVIYNTENSLPASGGHNERGMQNEFCVLVRLGARYFEITYGLNLYTRITEVEPFCKFEFIPVKKQAIEKSKRDVTDLILEEMKLMILDCLPCIDVNALLVDAKRLDALVDNLLSLKH